MGTKYSNSFNKKKLHFFTACYALERQTVQEHAFNTGKVICQWYNALTLKEETYSQNYYQL